MNTPKKIVQSVLLGTAIAVAFTALVFGVMWLTTFAELRAFAAHYWWVPFSAAYTVGSTIWSVHVERRIRKLKSEQTVINWIYNDLRHDVDDVERFLEARTTPRRIEIAHPRKRIT